MSILNIVLTHSCNLKCQYCPIRQDEGIISLKVAKKSILLSLLNFNDLTLRFSGGEPFLHFDLLKKIIDFARRQNELNKKKFSIEITTNGTFIDSKILQFLKDLKNLTLFVSMDGDSASHLLNRIPKKQGHDIFFNFIKYKHVIARSSRVVVNMVIAPNTVQKFFKNFLYCKIFGFNKFNFLPALFIYWPKNKLKILKNEFDRIYNFLKFSGIDLYIHNCKILSKIPLFNEGYIIDCNGDIFENNFFLSRLYFPYRDQLKIANINNIDSLKNIRSGNFDANIFMRMHTPPEILKSTFMADGILTDFVQKCVKLNV